MCMMPFSQTTKLSLASDGLTYPVTGRLAALLPQKKQPTAAASTPLKIEKECDLTSKLYLNVNVDLQLLREVLRSPAGREKMQHQTHSPPIPSALSLWLTHFPSWSCSFQLSEVEQHTLWPPFWSSRSAQANRVFHKGKTFLLLIIFRFFKTCSLPLYTVLV